MATAKKSKGAKQAKARAKRLRVKIRPRAIRIEEVGEILNKAFADTVRELGINVPSAKLNVENVSSASASPTNSVGRGVSAGASALVERFGTVDETIDELNALNGQLGNLCDRIQKTNDRVLGAYPDDGGVAGAPPRCGQLGVLADAVQLARTSTERAHILLDRLTSRL